MGQTHRCPFCRSRMGRVEGRHGPYIECLAFDCDARVGLHPDGTPKGTPARFHLRKWRQAAHMVFDSLWRGDALNVPLLTRTQAYVWLEDTTGIKHIAECNVRQCAAVMDAVRELLEREGKT